MNNPASKSSLLLNQVAPSVAPLDLAANHNEPLEWRGLPSHPDVYTEIVDRGRPNYLTWEEIVSVQWPTESDGGAFGMIWRHQHPPSCKNQRFLVWTVHKEGAVERDTRGVGSYGTTFLGHLALAVRLNRILITDERLWILAKTPECEGKQYMDCYYLPLSNCSLKDIPPNATEHIIIDNEPVIPPEPIVVRTYHVWFKVISRVEGWGLGPLPRIAHDSIGLAYYFQVQPWIREKIEATMRKAFPKWFDPQRTIGMPVRGSDKCRGHRLEKSAAGETDCMNFADRMVWAERLRKFDPRVDTIILTTEDESIVKEAQSYIKDGWKFIFNPDDVMQGTGSATTLNYYKNVTRAEAVVSALTSLHMQLRARYFLLTSTSTWHNVIGILARNDIVTLARDRLIFDLHRRPGTDLALLMASGCEAQQDVNHMEYWTQKFHRGKGSNQPIERPFY